MTGGARATWLTAYLLGEMALVWAVADRDLALVPDVLAHMEKEIRELGRMAGAEVQDDADR